MINPILLLILVVSALIVLGLLYLFFLRKKDLNDSLSQDLLVIRLPKRENKEGDRDFKEEINESAQLFSLLASLKKPFTLEAAVPHIGESIHFFLAIHRKIKATAIRQIHGVWPEAEIKESGDFNIFNPHGASSIGYLKTTKSISLPIRTYSEVNDDTFAPILSGLSKINDVGEGAAIQLIVKPVTKGGIKKSILNTAKDIRSGKDESLVFKTQDSLVKEFGKAIISNPLPQKKEENQEQNNQVDNELLDAVMGKASKPLFEVNVRLIASAQSQLEADSIIDGLSAGFANLSSPRRNEFTLIKPRNNNSAIYNFSFRNFVDKQTIILNSEELASIFHFPTSSSDVPRINWLSARESSPPNILSASGTLVGETSFRSEKKPIYISEEDRRRHVYMIGQTGTGKSTLLTNMVLSDIRAGSGTAIIDPHGDLVETISSLIPDERMNDVIIINPGDFNYPIGLNMLEWNREKPEEKTFIVNEIQGILNKLFPPETMGPMFEQYMRNALLLLMEDTEPATLIEVPRIFTDSEFRKQKLARIHNPSVIDFWTKEAQKAGGDAALENMTPYITSKFNNFIANDYIRPIIGQTKSSFNFRQAMDQKKIILVNLSKGRIGDINAGLLGMITVGKILMAALSRVDVAESERPDFNLYIDEFQNFTTDSIATILSEARKYRLNLVIAHQFLAQLTDQIRDSVFGNVGSLISFRIGATDAETLVKQFEPVFSVKDLINIDNYNAYVKLLIKGQPSIPFNIKTLPSDTPSHERGVEVANVSRQKYGKLRNEIEQDILKRLRT